VKGFNSSARATGATNRNASERTKARAKARAKERSNERTGALRSGVKRLPLATDPALPIKTAEPGLRPAKPQADRSAGFQADTSTPGRVVHSRTCAEHQGNKWNR